MASAPGDHAWRVLYVDDESINLRLMRDMFRVVFGREGQVVTVDCGEDALAALEQGRFDVVVTDQRMPTMPGTVLLARARERWPEMGRIILTGYPTDREVQEALRAGVVQQVVPKPWRPADLEEAIRRAVPLPSVP
jgi:CheY-like chemotaxis protein